MREILFATLLLLAGPAAAGNNAPAEAAIKKVVAQVDTCVNEKDAKCLGELFASDATFSGPMDGGKLVTGKSVVVQSFDKMMKQPGPKEVKQVRTVQKVRWIGEDRALVDADVKNVGAKEEQGTPEGAWHSTMLMKLENEKWLLEDVRFYVVVTGPPPTPGPTFATPAATKAVTPAPTKAGTPDPPAVHKEPAEPATS